MSERITRGILERSLLNMCRAMGVRKTTQYDAEGFRLDRYGYGGGFRVEKGGSTPLSSSRQPARIMREILYSVWMAFEWRARKLEEYARECPSYSLFAHLSIESIDEMTTEARRNLLARLIVDHNAHCAARSTQEAIELINTHTPEQLRKLYRERFGKDGEPSDYPQCHVDMAHDLASDNWSEYRL